MKSFSYLSVLAVLIFTLSVSAVQDVHAVKFTGSQTGPGEWTYSLTYNPDDNFSACQPSTTITLTNLAGVIGATGPNATDLNAPGALDWIPTVSNGGTKVVWTHVGGGTGNYSIDKHVFGFKVFANATNGPVDIATDGFAIDTQHTPPCKDLDIVNSTSGPTLPPRIPIPVPTVIPKMPIEFDKCIVNGHLICKINFDFFMESLRCFGQTEGPQCPLDMTKDTLLEIKQEFPPLKQVKAGIDLKDVVATKGQVLIIDVHRSSPISVKQKTAEMFMSRTGENWHHFP